MDGTLRATHGPTRSPLLLFNMTTQNTSKNFEVDQNCSHFGVWCRGRMQSGRLDGV